METVVRGAMQDSRNKVAVTKVAANLQAQHKAKQTNCQERFVQDLTKFLQTLK